MTTIDRPGVARSVGRSPSPSLAPRDRPGLARVAARALRPFTARCCAAALAIAAADPGVASAQVMHAVSIWNGLVDLSIVNPSTTDRAHLIYTVRGSAMTAEAIASGTGIAAADGFLSFLRTDTPQDLLTLTASVSAPPGGTASAPDVPPVAFTIDLDPGATATIAGLFSFSTLATIPVSTGAATARLTTRFFAEFFNASLTDLPVTFNVNVLDDAALLLVGTDMPGSTGRAAVVVDGFPALELTTEGGLAGRVVPPVAPFTLARGETLTLGGSALVEARAALVPEPATLVLVGPVALALAAGAARRAARRAG